MTPPLVEHRLFLLFVVYCLPVLLYAQEPAQLEPRNAVERQIAGDQTHNYKLRLSVGQYFRVLVSQRGVDVIVMLSAPDGNKVVEVDSPTGKQGDEYITAIAETTGEYSIVVRPLDGNRATGHYEIHWIELREATLQDHTRIRAERLQMEAKLLSIKGRANSPQVIEKQQEALKLWEEVEDKEQTANTLMVLGEKYFVADQNEQATISYERARVLYHQLTDLKNEGTALQQLGQIYMYSDQFGKALDYFHQALVIEREVKNRLAEARTLTSISMIYSIQLKNNKKASEYREQALVIYRETQDRFF